MLLALHFGAVPEPESRYGADRGLNGQRPPPPPALSVTDGLSKLNRVAVLLGCEDALAVPWAELRFQHVAAVRAKLQEENLATATVNATLAALKGVARAAFNLGLMSGDDHERIRSVKAVRGEKLLTGRALTTGEVSALLRAR